MAVYGANEIRTFDNDVDVNDWEGRLTPPPLITFATSMLDSISLVALSSPSYVQIATLLRSNIPPPKIVPIQQHFPQHQHNSSHLLVYTFCDFYISHQETK